MITEDLKAAAKLAEQWLDEGLVTPGEAGMFFEEDDYEGDGIPPNALEKLESGAGTVFCCPVGAVFLAMKSWYWPDGFDSIWRPFSKRYDAAADRATEFRAILRDIQEGRIQ